MNKQDKQLDFTGQKVFVGMDVHKQSWKVATCTEYLNPTKWPVTVRKPFVVNLKKYLDKHFRGADFVCSYEAGFSGFWIQKELEKVGIKTIVAHAADIPTSDKERKQKEDKRDARKITKALKSGHITGIYVPGDQSLLDRSVVRERYSIAKSGRRIKSQIKSHLALYNIDIPDEMTNKHWSANFINWLKDEVKKHEDLTLDLQIDRLEKLRKLQLRANRAVRQLGMKPRHEELYRLLLSVPGIGPLTAMLLISELIDMRRFSNVDQLMSYAGFIPTTSGSGEKEKKGRLTKRCNGRIKSALVESSWVAIRIDSGLMLKYCTLKKRMTGQEAIIRIARNLLIKIRAVWLSGEVYKKGIS